MYGSKYFIKHLKRNDGYVLVNVVLMSLLIISIIGYFIHTIAFYNIRLSRQIHKQQLRIKSYSAMQELLIDSEFIKNNEGYIYTEDGIDFEINPKYMGYNKYYDVRVESGHDSSLIRYYVGLLPIGYFDNAITIAKSTSNLSVAGFCTIKGSIQSSANSIKRGKIFGIKNSTEHYFDGKLLLNKEIDDRLLDIATIQNNFNSDFSSEGVYKTHITVLDSENIREYVHCDSTLFFENLLISGDVLSNNYHNTEIMKIHIQSDLLIERDVKYNVPTMIICKGDVLIEENCSISNLILYAEGDVVVEESKLYDVQVLSNSNINLRNSKCFYPTNLGIYVNTSDSTKIQDSLSIVNSVVNGTLLLMSNSIGLTQNRSKIVVDDKSSIQGIVYSENYFEGYGLLIGSLFTYATRYYIKPTEYINWLINFECIRDELNNNYLLPAVFELSKNDYYISNEIVIY